MDKNAVKTIPLFAGVPKRRHEQVASWADQVDVPAGQTIIRQGGFAQEFCVIVSGSAELLQNGQRIARLGAGDFFGEAGMLGNGWRHAETVVTTAATRLLVVGRREFPALMATLPEVAEQIRHDAERRARVRRRLRSLQPLPAAG